MIKKRNISGETNAEQVPTLSEEMIGLQLQRILASPEFLATDRQKDFLKFVVDETLAGRANEIKGYTIATRLFGRNQDFDQATDPIVSIQANKLRRALERYYLVGGIKDPVLIDIPKGTYVPVFQERIGTGPDRTVDPAATSRDRFEGSWPSMVIRTFRNLTGDENLNYLALGLANELALEITRYKEIRVLFIPTMERERRVSDSGARFTLEGDVRKASSGIRLNITLTDTATSEQIWGDVHESGLEPDQLIAFQERIASVISAKVAGERGIISKVISLESRSIPLTGLKTYESILRYYEYDLTLTPDSFSRAFKALVHAVNLEPDCGTVNSMLGRLYGNIYSLELPGFESALEKAVSFAERGVQLEPESQRARVTLALIRMFSDEVPAGLMEARRALELNPNSYILLDGIAYILTLSGDWEQGTALIRKVIRSNPYYGLYVHYALWLDWTREEKHEKAYLETMNFRRPTVFWEPLMKASTLGHLGRIVEGNKNIDKLLELKPDFRERGRILIGHYIKFEDLVERTVDGLRKSGLDIN